MQITKHTVLMMLCLGCGTAAAWQPTMTVSEVKDDCEQYKVTCVRHWGEMSAKERADLWPYLDEVARTLNWRIMSVDERKAMRNLLSAPEREALRRRFASNSNDHDTVHSGSVKHVNLKRLCKEDRTLMREQIMEFHVERVSRRPAQSSEDRRSREIVP